MNDQDLVETLRATFKEGTIISKVFNLLSDQKWHCRSCEGRKIASSDQYAGGGGIQGLERGTKSRSGLIIESENYDCQVCQKKTRWDRWTGKTRTANASTNIPPKLIERILSAYRYIDVIEQRKRAKHELVIDHRFPMERWGEVEKSNNPEMTDDEIRAKFQLLKKDSTGNHNLLKSRSCERCIETGKRGTPFGIRFWYEGDENWSQDIPQRGKDAEQGCVGCGWYDFETWRKELNKKLENSEQ